MIPDMTPEEIATRMEELEPYVQEARYLELYLKVAYFVDEGFVEIEGDRLYFVGEAEHIDD